MLNRDNLHLGILKGIGESNKLRISFKTNISYNIKHKCLVIQSNLRFQNTYNTFRQYTELTISIEACDFQLNYKYYYATLCCCSRILSCHRHRIEINEHGQLMSTLLVFFLQICQKPSIPSSYSKNTK